MKKEDCVMENDFVLEWDGKEIPSLDDELSEEELKKDGRGCISGWKTGDNTQLV